MDLCHCLFTETGLISLSLQRVNDFRSARWHCVGLVDPERAALRTNRAYNWMEFLAGSTWFSLALTGGIG